MGPRWARNHPDKEIEEDVVQAPSSEAKSTALFFPGERNPEAPGHRLDVEFGRLSAFENGLDDVRGEESEIEEPAGVRT